MVFNHIWGRMQNTVIS